MRGIKLIALMKLEKVDRWGWHMEKVEDLVHMRIKSWWEWPRDQNKVTIGKLLSEL